jgi:hypothetical protein
MYAFRDCQKLTKVIIPEGVETIEDYTFMFCYSLAEVNLPGSVTAIGVNAFRYCGFTSIALPENLQSIGNGALSGCENLVSVVIPESVTSIGGGVFEGCTNLTSVTFPQHITTIPELTFQNCTGLVSFDIPQQITEIGSLAFYGCTELASVTISKSITNIEEYAFNGCTGLKEVSVEWETPLSIQETVFSEVDLLLCTLKVPQGTVTDYRNAPVWKDFGRFIESENGQTSINDLQTDNICITTNNGTVIIKNAEQMPVRIYTVNGVCCVSVSKASAFEVFPLPAGVYVVRAGEINWKVIV